TGRGRIGSGVLAVDFDFLHLDPPPPFYRTAGPRAERFVKSAAISKRWGRQARACSLLLGCGALEISRAGGQLGRWDGRGGLEFSLPIPARKQLCTAER